MTNIEREIERIASRALRESHLAGGAPIGILDGLEAFAAAIDFTERPIVAILAFHAIFILTAVLTRKKMEVQIGLLVVARQDTCEQTNTSGCVAALIQEPVLICSYVALLFVFCVCVFPVVSVLSASSLNSYGTLHWQWLGFRQNYFDSFGVFVSVLGSMPVILTSFGILIHAIYQASGLLVTVKRKQLGIDKRGTGQAQKKKEDATTTPGATAASSSVPSETVRAGDADREGQSPPAPVAAGVKQRKSAKAR